MPNEEYEDTISDELRARLCQIFALGYLDQMAGYAVTDEDLIERRDAETIETAALACIAASEAEIMESYPENPQSVHDEVYRAGKAAYAEAALWHMQRN